MDWLANLFSFVLGILTLGLFRKYPKNNNEELTFFPPNFLEYMAFPKEFVIKKFLIIVIQRVDFYINFPLKVAVCSIQSKSAIINLYKE